MQRIYVRSTLLLAGSLALAQLVGCEGRGGEVVQLFPREQTGEILGTARDDLWLTRDYVNALTEIIYFDGITERPVLMPSLFSGGKRPLLVAAARGEVWMGSLRRDSTSGSYARVLLGKLDSQGNFEDHSSDFPVGPEHPYKSIILHGCEGDVLMDITLETSGSPPTTTRELYSYTAEGRVEVAIPPTVVSSFSPSVYMVGRRDYFLIGQNTFYARTLHYVDGDLRTDDVPPPDGYRMARSMGHRWAYSEDKYKTGSAPVYSYDGHSFHEVPINLHFAAGTSGRFTSFARLLGVVPQSDETFMWVGVETEGYWGGSTNDTVIGRHYDGNKLSREDIILSDTVECANDSSDADEECLDISYLRSLAVLEDGSILVDKGWEWKPGLVPKTFIITVDDAH